MRIMADEIEELQAKVAKLEAEAADREPKYPMLGFPYYCHCNGRPLTTTEVAGLDFSKGIDQTVITERP